GVVELRRLLPVGQVAAPVREPHRDFVALRLALFFVVDRALLCSAHVAFGRRARTGEPRAARFTFLAADDGRPRLIASSLRHEPPPLGSLAAALALHVHVPACAAAALAGGRNPARDVAGRVAFEPDLRPLARTQLHLHAARVVDRGHLAPHVGRSEEHTSELQSRFDLVCRLLLEKKKQYHYSPLYINRPRITIPRICSISRSLPLPSSQDCDGRLYQFQNLRSDVYWTTALISRSE